MKRGEDPRVLSAYLRAQSAVDSERDAFGGLLPQVTANGSYNRILRKDETEREIYNNSSYSLNLTQYLYNKQAWETYQKAKSTTEQKSHQAEDAQAEATVDLAKRYFLALSADDELELIMAERRATQKPGSRQCDVRQKMAAVTDLLDLKARVDLLAAQEIDARNQIRLSRAGLSEIVGRPINEPLSRIRNDIALQAPAKSMDTWVAQAIDSNPLLKARESSLDVANAAVREGKGGHYPTLTFTLGAQQSDVGYDNTLSPRSWLCGYHRRACAYLQWRVDVSACAGPVQRAIGHRAGRRERASPGRQGNHQRLPDSVLQRRKDPRQQECAGVCRTVEHCCAESIFLRGG